MRISDWSSDVCSSDPAHGLEQPVDLPEQAVSDDRVQALTVVVDHPPDVADVVLPALQKRLVDVALVQLRVADKRDHTALPPVLAGPALEADIVLGQRREAGDRRAEPDGAGGEIDIVRVLGARGIGLRAAERPEPLQLLTGDRKSTRLNSSH